MEGPLTGSCPAASCHPCARSPALYRSMYCSSSMSRRHKLRRHRAPRRGRGQGPGGPEGRGVGVGGWPWGWMQGRRHGDIGARSRRGSGAAGEGVWRGSCRVERGGLGTRFKGRSAMCPACRRLARLTEARPSDFVAVGLRAVAWGWMMKSARGNAVLRQESSWTEFNPIGYLSDVGSAGPTCTKAASPPPFRAESAKFHHRFVSYSSWPWVAWAAPFVHGRASD